MSRDENKLKTQTGAIRERQEETLKWLASETASGPGEICPVHPGQEMLQQAIKKLQAITRQQQLQTEQCVGNTLTQAATALQDARRTDAMAELLQVLEGKLQDPAAAADPKPFLQVIEQIELHLQQQLQETDNQVAQAMQQAVSALAQSQAAMSDNQIYSQIRQLLQHCKNILQKQWSRADNNSVIH